MCGGKPTQAVCRQVQDADITNKSVCNGGIQSGINNPYGNLWLLVPHLPTELF